LSFPTRAALKDRLKKHRKYSGGVMTPWFQEIKRKFTDDRFGEPIYIDTDDPHITVIANLP